MVPVGASGLMADWSGLAGVAEDSSACTGDGACVVGAAVVDCVVAEAAGVTGAADGSCAEAIPIRHSTAARTPSQNFRGCAKSEESRIPGKTGTVAPERIPIILPSRGLWEL